MKSATFKTKFESFKLQIRAQQMNDVAVSLKLMKHLSLSQKLRTKTTILWSMDLPLISTREDRVKNESTEQSMIQMIDHRPLKSFLPHNRLQLFLWNRRKGLEKIEFRNLLQFKKLPLLLSLTNIRQWHLCRTKTSISIQQMINFRRPLQMKWRIGTFQI